MRRFLSILILTGLVQFQLWGQCGTGETQIIFEIDSLGSFPEEVSWRLIDESTETEVFAREAGFLTSNVVRDTLCLLNNATYRFEAYDSYGDGWNSNEYTIFYIDGFIIKSGMPDNGDTGSGQIQLEESYSFTVGERPGDDCTTPAVINVNETVAVNTALYSNSYVLDPLFDSGREAIFQFTPSVTDNYSIALTNFASLDQGSLQLFDNCYDSNPTRIAFDSTGIANDSLEILQPLNEGTTYFVVVSNNTSSGTDAIQADLSITYSGDPINITCADAFNLTVDGAPVSSRLYSPTPSQSPLFNLTTTDSIVYESYAGPLTYDFTLGSLQDIVIQIDGYDDFQTSYVELVKQATCLDAPEATYKRVITEGSSRVFAFNDLLAGTYKLNIYLPSFAGTGSFQVSAKTFASMDTAVNQDCASAISSAIVPSGQSYSTSDVQWMSLFNGSDSGLPAPCGQDSIFTTGTSDVWLRAQVPSSRNLTVQTFGELYDVFTAGDQAIETRFSVYSGTCGSLTEIYCSDKFENHQKDTLSYLTAGEEIFIRFWDKNGDDSGKFGVVLSDPGSLPQPQTSTELFPDSLSINFQFFSEAFTFDYNVKVSADSFATFLPSYNPAVVSSMDGQLGVSGLSPATTYYLQIWSSKEGLTNSDTSIFQVETAPLVINSIANGNWSDPSIWQNGTVPAADSAVNIYHKVSLNPGESFDIKGVNIIGGSSTELNVGLWINNANLNVDKDIRVNHNSGVLTDSVGVFMFTDGVSSSNLTVGSNLLFELFEPTNAEPIRFLAHNNGDSLKINVGNEFSFRHSASDTTVFTGENIDFRNVDLTIGGNLYFFNDNNNSVQPFNAVFLDSRITANLFNLEAFENTNGRFQVNFTGTTQMDIKSNFRRSGNGGQIKFADQSILQFQGLSYQEISGFGDFQDSIIYNNVLVDIALDPNSDRKIPVLEILPSYEESFSKVLIEGNLNLVSGLLNADNEIYNFGFEEVVFGENASVAGQNPTSYIHGPAGKIGNSAFTFPVGHNAGLRQIRILNNNEFQPTDMVRVSPYNNFCGLNDSLLVNSSLVRDRVKEYWEITSVLSDSTVAASFEPIISNPVEEGITDFTSLELVNFYNGSSLGNAASTDSSFQSGVEYSFSAADTARFGLASNLEGENPFYYIKEIASLSQSSAAPGENVTINFSGPFALASDQVFVGGMLATTVSSTQNSLNFTVPEGARSGGLEIVRSNGKIIYGLDNFTVKYATAETLTSANYQALTPLGSINGTISLGQAHMQLGQIDNDANFDAMIVSSDYQPVTLLKNLSGTPALQEFSLSVQGNILNPTDFHLGRSNANGQVAMDAFFEINFGGGLIYFANDGNGNYSAVGDGNSDSQTEYTDYLISDTDFDGFSDLLVSAIDFSSSTSLIIGESSGGNDCSPYAKTVLPYLEPQNKGINQLVTGNFINNGNTDIAYLINGESMLGLLDIYSQDTINYYSNNSRTADQIFEIKKISLLNDGFDQIIASNQSTNEIEVYSFNSGTASIDIVSIPISFTPAKMDAEDINGDGFQDLIVSDQNSASLHVLLNDGAGQLTEDLALTYTGGVFVDFDVLDLNSDGYKDFIMLQEGGQLSAAYYETLNLNTPNISASNITTSSFDLGWGSVENAAEYEIFISLENDTIADLSTDSTIMVGDTSISFEAPSPFETYYVFGRAISSAGDTSNYSNPVTVNLLTLDSLNFQAQNITTSTFDLIWSSIDNAAEYEVFISLENDTIANLATDTTVLLGDTLLSFDAPLPFETYYVFGRTISAVGDTSSFSSPFAVNLLTLDSLSFQSSNITHTGFDISWNTVANAGSYELVISLQDSLNAGLNSDSVFQVTDTVLNFNAPVDFQEYFVFGRAISTQGDTANFGNSFSVQLESIQVPVPTASNLNSNGFDLSWPAVAGADQYQVYIGTNSDTTSIGENDSLFSVSNLNVSYQAPEYSELYYFFVKAISNSGDTSAFSSQDSVKLPVSSYLQQDSLAMVSLYETNGGDAWTNKQNWLTGKLNTWQGLEMNSDTLVAIALPSNGLEGILTNDIGGVNFLNSVDFSNNSLTDVSALVGQANNLNFLNLSGNTLSFEQLDDLSSIPNFIYGNQAFRYDLPVEIFESLGTDISITVEASSAGNTFQWYKDSVQITGETASVLNLTNAQRSDEGRYYVEINNTLLPNLTLVSNISEVKISSLERDVVALRQFYDSTNGDGWSTIIWDTTSDNPTEWSANGQDIIVENNRVVELNLPSNNLTGSIPTALNQVRGLRRIDLSGNAIEDAADLTALPNLTELVLSGNALGFDDLERNIAVEGFEFNNQANFGNERDQKIPQGSDFILSYEVEGSANVYEWYRNDVLINDSDTSEIIIDSITFESMGEYRLEVRNAIVNAVNPDFTLNSNPVNITASSSISGNVQDANEFATQSGRIYLFIENADGSYDSVRLNNGNFFQNIQGDGSFKLENVELGDYLIYVNNDESNYPDLLNTYYPNTIDWELAEPVALRSEISGLKIIMEGEPQELAGTSVVSGYLEEEYEEGERKLPARRVSGVGVSVRTLVGSSRSVAFRSILENSDLVAYLETDENGEFEIPNLPAGSYTIKFDIPGVPMNEQSDINFDLTGEDQEALEIAAVSDNGQITVARVSYTANKAELFKNVTVYPNPSDGRFKIVGTESISTIKIISSEGRLIEEISDLKSSQEEEVDLSSYPDGMYFMQIIWKDGLSSMNKLIKK